MRIRVPWAVLARRLADRRECVGCGRPPTLSYEAETVRTTAGAYVSFFVLGHGRETVYRRPVPCCDRCAGRAVLLPAGWAVFWAGALAFSWRLLTTPTHPLARFGSMGILAAATFGGLGFVVLRRVARPIQVHRFEGEWEDPTWIDVTLGNEALAEAVRADAEEAERPPAPADPGDTALRAELDCLAREGASAAEAAAQLRRRLGLSAEEARDRVAKQAPWRASGVLIGRRGATPATPPRPRRSRAPLLAGLAAMLALGVGAAVLMLRSSTEVSKAVRVGQRYRFERGSGRVEEWTVTGIEPSAVLYLRQEGPASGPLGPPTGRRWEVRRKAREASEKSVSVPGRTFRCQELHISSHELSPDEPVGTRRTLVTVRRDVQDFPPVIKRWGTRGEVELELVDVR